MRSASMAFFPVLNEMNRTVDYTRRGRPGPVEVSARQRSQTSSRFVPSMPFFHANSPNAPASEMSVTISVRIGGEWVSSASSGLRG